MKKNKRSVRIKGKLSGFRPRVAYLALWRPGDHTTDWQVIGRLFPSADEAEACAKNSGGPMSGKIRCTIVEVTLR